MQFLMEDLKSEGWKRLLIPHGAARTNSTNLLRRSSSWRSPKEPGYYESPVAQVNRPPRTARPQSCIEGGTADKWLQTLERIQSRPLQRQKTPFVDKTVSMPALPNEMTGGNSGRKRTPRVCPSLGESSVGSLEFLETRGRSERSNTVHVKPSPSTERAQFCSLAPVRFGWLPIERHVILTDISNNGCRHDNSSYQQKLKSPITPVLLGTPAKLKGSGTNGRELEQSVRPESVGFRYGKTPVKASYSHHQASGSVSSEGGGNGSQIWNPTANFTSSVRSPETSEPASKHPTYRRGSVQELPSIGCARKFSSSISSITITSKKVTRSFSLPDTSRPMAMNDRPTDSPGGLATPVPPQRKALVVKVTEQRTSITTTPGVNTIDHNTDHKGYEHPVVLRRKASIVKMVEQTERFRGGQPDATKTAQYRHSYTEGLHETDAIKHVCRSGVDTKANPVLLNQAFTASVSVNQWRSSTVHHRSSVSLHLNNPNDSRTVEERYETPRRPLSCDAGLFNRTDPTFHNKSPPCPQKTNIHLVSSREAEESSGFVSSTGNLDPVLGIKPLTLLKVPDDSPLPTARAVLALNAAAVITNIKLQTRHRQKRNTTTETQTSSHASAAGDGINSDGGETGGDGRNQTMVCFGSEDAPLSLREALALRRPDFIQRSQARVQALERRSQERQKTLRSPHRPEPTCSHHQEDNLLKSKDRRVGGKDAHLRSRRNDLLPEMRKRREDKRRKKEEEKRKLAYRTNRLRLELFKKKLLDQVLQRGNN
ncbi:(E2-independent) E3 ubiquitin-conjugating enzyme FATS isoform X1 [Triplophysa rosa]|uniref:(E2-independent) E3 ubiquitin-conjugating enzyme FATS isoform X1 n=1 Tax=Triplophysa rosa TaxID=992332 RepID=UPI002545CF97|nr:(E2-independent) E3 ubiquitin-conjugating enzyme FATS isoform X1 [Triplophysa rosa]